MVNLFQDVKVLRAQYSIDFDYNSSGLFITTANLDVAKAKKKLRGFCNFKTVCATLTTKAS